MLRPVDLRVAGGRFPSGPDRRRRTGPERTSVADYRTWPTAPARQRVSRWGSYTPRPRRPSRARPPDGQELVSHGCRIAQLATVEQALLDGATANGICRPPALVEEVSTTTLWRWLEEDPSKPWRHRSWIFPRDPDFAAKAGVVLDLYDRSFQSQRLGEGEYVISADEKTGIQARCRCHPTLPSGAARTMRVEHEYQRGGALAYLAAWDVHRARLFGRCEPTTGIGPFGRLVEQVMTVEPYASATRVFWIVGQRQLPPWAGIVQHSAHRRSRCVVAFSRLLWVGHRASGRRSDLPKLGHIGYRAVLPGSCGLRMRDGDPSGGPGDDARG
jgi:hypothetical protein